MRIKLKTDWLEYRAGKVLFIEDTQGQHLISKGRAEAYTDQHQPGDEHGNPIHRPQQAK